MMISLEDTKVAYVGPRSVLDISAVWDAHVMWNHEGRRMTLDEAIKHHKDRVGDVISFTHENESDPAAVAYAVADALDAQDGTYFVAVDAHEREIDGKRLLARVIVRCGDGVLNRRELTLPWESGSPALDLDTLLDAGLPREQAERLVERLGLGEEPEDAPRP